MAGLPIGDYLKTHPVVLAPMAGITDRIFRQLVREQVPGLVYTEMISAKALSYHNLRTESLLDIQDEEPPVAVQLFGSDPAILAAAAQRAAALGAALVDINMGCPVPKVVKNREGSALLLAPELAGRLVTAAAKAVDIPVSVKIRLGFDEERIVVPDFARRMEAAGAAMIAVHGRTREQYYSGKADWQGIRLVKEAVAVPVIGNGDVWSPADGAALLAQTGCDGVMIGRGALGNPWLLGRTARFLAGCDPGSPPTAAEKITMALTHCRRLIAAKGEAKGIPEMRKHLAWYLKGLPRTAKLKERLFRTVDLAGAQALLLAYMAEYTDRPMHKLPHEQGSISDIYLR